MDSLFWIATSLALSCLAEVSILFTLRHPRIVSLYDVVEGRDHLHLASWSILVYLILGFICASVQALTKDETLQATMRARIGPSNSYMYIDLE